MHLSIRNVFTTLALLILSVFILVGCGDDPVDPVEPPAETTVPELPVPATFLEHMEVSDELEMETVAARNFTPVVAGCGDFLDRLNDIDLRYAYRVTVGRRYELVQEGEIIDPRLDLEYRVNEAGRTWHNLEPHLTGPPYRHLGQIGDKHYYVSRHRCKWHMANTTSQMAGGHLASIHDQAVNDSVMTLAIAAGYNQNLLIGLHQYHGAAKWTDGTALDFENWDGGEPSHSTEDYIEIQAPTSNNRFGSWNDTKHFALRYLFMSTERIPDSPAGTEELSFRGNKYDPSPNHNSYMFLHGAHRITESPYLKKVRYWKPLYQFELYPTQQFQQTFEYWKGVTESYSETTQSFGLNLGLDISNYDSLGDWDSVTDWTNFLGDLKGVFSETFTTAGSEVTRGERIEYFYGTEMAEDRAGKLVFWQLRERVYVVDGDGAAWEDPNYVLDDVPYLDYGLDHFSPQLTMFPPPGDTE